MGETIMEPLYIEISKKKAEAPALIVLLVGCFVGWAFHFGILGTTAGFVWLAICLTALFWLYQKRKGTYFVKVDADSISFRLHFFSSFKMIPWKYLQRIDYLAYEINFMLKETAQVVSLATSSLDDEDTEKLKECISQAIANRGE